MRLLVCGGRSYSNMLNVMATLDDYHKHFKIDVLIQGGAKGADALAKLWAQNNGIPTITMDANWDFYAKKAGSTRNGWMIEHARPDEVIAFPGGPGTVDMCRQAEQNNIKVWKIAQ